MTRQRQAMLRKWLKFPFDKMTLLLIETAPSDYYTMRAAEALAAKQWDLVCKLAALEHGCRTATDLQIFINAVLPFEPSIYETHSARRMRALEFLGSGEWSIPVTRLMCENLPLKT